MATGPDFDTLPWDHGVVQLVAQYCDLRSLLSLMVTNKAMRDAVESTPNSLIGAVAQLRRTCLTWSASYGFEEHPNLPQVVRDACAACNSRFTVQYPKANTTVEFVELHDVLGALCEGFSHHGRCDKLNVLSKTIAEMRHRPLDLLRLASALSPPLPKPSKRKGGESRRGVISQSGIVPSTSAQLDVGDWFGGAFSVEGCTVHGACEERSMFSALMSRVDFLWRSAHRTTHSWHAVKVVITYFDVD